MSRRNELSTLTVGFKGSPFRPNFHKKEDLITDLYTEGGQFMLLDVDPTIPRADKMQRYTANEYVGYYHIFSNGAVYTGRTYTAQSRKLDRFQHTLLSEVPRIDVAGNNMMSDNTKRYRLMTGRAFHNHIVPRDFLPNPDVTSYRRGNFNRYFAQKRTDLSLIEISETMYFSLNNDNSAGLDQFTYYADKISWSISGKAQDVRNANRRVLERKEIDLPGITNYLPDLLEFWRGEDIIDDEYQFTNGGELRYADGRDFIGFYHTLTDGTLKEGVRASSAERAILFRV
jgi:hypothetical protein